MDREEMEEKGWFVYPETPSSPRRVVRYSHTATPVPTKPGCWDYLKVEIWMEEDGDAGLGHIGKKKIGEYTRKYSGMYNTFVPFRQGGKEYALYSSDYTCTSVMELPSCKKVAGEKPDTWGFCPVDFLVPYEPECGLAGQFGFVAGCVWGDDCDWKVQYLDLSRISEGIIIRNEKFGYVPISRGMSLKQAIGLDDYFVGEIDGKKYEDTRITIASQPLMFDLKKDYRKFCVDFDASRVKPDGERGVLDRWIKKVETVSKPGAALEVRRYELTDDAKRLLQVPKEAWNRVLEERESEDE